MDLELSIVERLEKLRMWQIEQQERLLKQQQAQREILSHEQDRMYKALELSVQDINFGKAATEKILTDAEDTSRESSVMDFAMSRDEIRFKTDVQASMETHNASPPSNRSAVESHEDQGDDSSSRKEYPSRLIVPPLELAKSTGYLRSSVRSTYNADNGRGDRLDGSFNTTPQKARVSEISIEGVEPLPLDPPAKTRLMIDDLPVPSPKKDFHTLLEERLKDCDVAPAVESKKVKRPFLRKGEGLARFRMNQDSQVSKNRIRPRSASLSANMQFGNKDGKKNGAKSKERRSTSAVGVQQTKLSLKNVPLPRKKVRSKSESGSPNVQQKAKDEQCKQVVELNESDLETKTQREMEEIRIFELLEEKAENSSFCSTSSAVIAFLQQSTPFRVKNKAQTNENVQSNDLRIKNQQSQGIKRQLIQKEPSTARIAMERCQKMQNDAEDSLQDYASSYWESAKYMNAREKEQLLSSSMKSINFQQSRSNANERRLQDNIHLCTMENQSSFYSTNSENENENAADVSLHVRFAEFNEYKTIGLTDTSSISNESITEKHYADEKAWSDCPETPESSDAEVSVLKIESAIVDNRGRDANSGHGLRDYTCDTDEEESLDTIGPSSDDEKCTMSENLERLAGKTTVSTNTYANGCSEKKSIDEESADAADETIFKSELLKNRLIELEREIDIFRKENTALSLQRQKLQEEYVKMHKEFQKKERDFEELRKKAEDRLQEEKKKLSREKAALESRLRDAQEKAQQSKAERLAVQSMKEQLETLREEMNNKESRWNAAQSRQRSQMRILRVENAKLKEEIEKLQNSKKTNYKSRKSSSLSNTRALHQLNKQLHNQMQENSTKIRDNSVSEDEERYIQPVMESIFPESDTTKMSYKSVRDTNDKGNGQHRSENVQESMERVAKKRNLYDHLLKDATSYLTDSQETKLLDVSNIRSHDHKGNTQTKKQTPKKDEIENFHPCSDQDSADTDADCNNIDERKFDSSKNNNRHNSEPNPISESSEVASVKERGSLNASLNNSSDQKQNVRKVQHVDGRIEYWFPNGNVKKIFPDLGLTKMIYYNGDVRESDKDGKIKYFYASSRTWHTTMPDGLEILEFPDGQVERRCPEGTVEISFPDGSIRIVKPDGSEKWALPDGTMGETFTNGEKIFTLPNGQQEIHTSSHKRREYPDGTVKLVYPDGTQETRYANGRIRLKDKDGNLLMDSYQ